jgi:hypothetical protein|tara:strand:+ start:2163 stop:2360 length:198 start_codon:yes stop_codon:yes gene_type:complete
MSNKDILKRLEKILESEARNYFESSERLFIMSLVEKAIHDNQHEFSKDELIEINKLINKYEKFMH